MVPHPHSIHIKTLFNNLITTIFWPFALIVFLSALDRSHSTLEDTLDQLVILPIHFFCYSSYLHIFLFWSLYMHLLLSSFVPMYIPLLKFRPLIVCFFPSYNKLDHFYFSFRIVGAGEALACRLLKKPVRHENYYRHRMYLVTNTI